MNLKNQEIKSMYLDGLRDYILEKNDQRLSEASGKSQKLLEEGFTEMNMIGLHHEALDSIFQSSDLSSHSEAIQRASTYLKEWLSPFEITIQSYRALNDELHKKNNQLEDEIDNRKNIQQELAESVTYFESLIENAQDIITVVDYRGIIRFDCPSIERLLGYKKEELIGENAFKYIHEEDVKKVRHAFYDIKTDPDNSTFIVFRFRHNNGEWRYLESTAKRINDLNEEPVIVINSRDITNRRKRMQKLKEHRAKLAEAQRIAKVGSWEWNIDKEPEMEWSDELCRIYGFDPEEFDNNFDTFLENVHPEDRIRIRQIIEKAYQNHEPFSLDYRIIRPDGELGYIYARGRPIVNEEGKLVKIMGIGQDITEQKLKEQKLQQYSERLRKLSARIEKTREQERIRIAREIHDELGQMLTVLKMDVSMMSGHIKKKVSGDILDYFNEEAEKILDRINTIISSVQRITTELRPEVLDDLGLVEAIEWQAKEFAKRINSIVNFNSKIKSTDFLTEDQITTIFRIFQETMWNIVRHSEATKVDIAIEKKNENLLLSVEDNGVGITQDQINAKSSFGIIGIRERARFLGGEVFIEGKKKEGTTVTLHIPIQED